MRIRSDGSARPAKEESIEEGKGRKGRGGEGDKKAGIAFARSLCNHQSKLHEPPPRLVGAPLGPGITCKSVLAAAEHSVSHSVSAEDRGIF